MTEVLLLVHLRYELGNPKLVMDLNLNKEMK
jgi:hypothetical protein